MLTDAIIGAEKLLQLTLSHNTPRFADITDEITYLIKLSKDTDMKASQELLQRIEERDLYHYAGEVKISDYRKVLEDGLPDEIMEKYNVSESDVLMHHLKLSYSNSQSYPLSMVSFYKYDKPDECFALYRKDMPRLLPSSFCEKNTIRFFSRKNHEKVKQMVTEIKLKYRN